MRVILIAIVSVPLAVLLSNDFSTAYAQGAEVSLGAAEFLKKYTDELADAKVYKNNGGKKPLREFPARWRRIDGGFWKAFSAREVLPESVRELRWDKLATSVELPLRWNSKNKRFDLLEKEAYFVPPSVLKFTLAFLIAHGSLSQELGKTNSTLSVGAAALLAADNVYSTNLTCLPREVQEPAAIVSILLLHNEELIKNCFGNRRPERGQSIDKAIERLCSMEANGKTHVILGPCHGIEFLEQEGRGLTLAEFLPPHRDSQEQLLKQIKKGYAAGRPVANLTVDALIVKELCTSLYGIPSIAPSPEEAAKHWGSELKLLREAAEEELALRSQKRFLEVSDWQNQPFRTNSDPTLLRVLLEMAFHAAAPDLKGDPADEADFLAILKEIPHTNDVLKLASPKDPRITMWSDVKRDGMAATLQWVGIRRCRPYQSERLYNETLRIHLISYQSISSKRLLGIDAKAFVTVEGAGSGQTGGEGKEVMRPLGDVKKGDKVRGYRGLDREGGSGPFPVFENAEKSATWFTVTNVQKSEIREETALPHLLLRFDDGQLAMGSPHRVLARAGTQLHWSRVGDLHPLDKLWSTKAPESVTAAQGTTATKQLDVLRIQESTSPVSLVELSLSGEETRGEATNILVSTAATGGVTILAEAGCVDAGPVDPSLSILVEGGKATIREVADDMDNLFIARAFGVPESEGPEALKGYPTNVEGSVDIPVGNVIILELEDHGIVTMGDGNWVFKFEDRQYKETRVSRLKRGDRLLANLDPVELVKVKGMSPSERTEETPFVMLQFANLPWAKIGPLLLSVDCHYRDAGATGISAGTQIAVKAASNGPPRMGQRWYTLGNTDVLEEEILTFDLARKAYAADRLSEQPRRWETTRSIEITAKGDSERTLVVGPGQKLLDGETFQLKRADDFQVGGTVRVAEPDGGEPGRWEVTGLSYRYHPPRDVFTLRTGMMPLYGELPTISGVAFANGFATEVERGHQRKPAPGRRPDEGLPGDGQSHTISGVDQARPGGLQVDSLNEPSTVFFPSDVQVLLEERAKTIWGVFQAERDGGRLKLPEESAVLKFWLDTLGDREDDLPSDEYLADAMEDRVSYVLALRQEFLADPLVDRLPRLCMRETETASWLWECGATETADWFLSDILELAIYAGCDRSTEKERLRSDLLGLALLLQVPSFVRGEHRGREKVDYRACAEVKKQLNGWQGVASETERDGDIAVEQLYIIWRLKGGRTPYWCLLHRPGDTPPVDDEKGKSDESDKRLKLFKYRQAAFGAFRGWLSQTRPKL